MELILMPLKKVHQPRMQIGMSLMTRKSKKSSRLSLLQPQLWLRALFRLKELTLKLLREVSRQQPRLWKEQLEIEESSSAFWMMIQM
jgi:hypothetical protein